MHTIQRKQHIQKPKHTCRRKQTLQMKKPRQLHHVKSLKTFSTQATSSQPLKQTPFYNKHIELGGSMVDYCNWSLPVRYKATAIAAHQHVRKYAGLFDVSHMGQVSITGDKRIEFIERILPVDMQKIRKHLAKLSVLPNERGGVIDDCMVTKRENDIYLVINAGCVDKDLKHIDEQVNIFNQQYPSEQPVHINYMKTRGLLALQGPYANKIMKNLFPTIDFDQVGFMNAQNLTLNYDNTTIPLWVTRCGYTGEDGFEIGCENEHASQLWDAILSYNNKHTDENAPKDIVLPIGLGVRDSLRLEAGLCLYGHELSQDISPIEAGLSWVISPRRKLEGGFIGSDAILEQLQKGPEKSLVGVITQSGGVPREHMNILHPETKEVIGQTTSGGCAPSLNNARIAMCYLNTNSKLQNGDDVIVDLRGKETLMKLTPLPFVKTNYYRVPKKV